MHEIRFNLSNANWKHKSPLFRFPHINTNMFCIFVYSVFVSHGPLARTMKHCVPPWYVSILLDMCYNVFIIITYNNRRTCSIVQVQTTIYLMEQVRTDPNQRHVYSRDTIFEIRNFPACPNNYHANQKYLSFCLYLTELYPSPSCTS